MPYAAVNGIELHYRIDGDRHGHAPWIVLSNSLGSDMSMWTPQVAALSKKFRVLRYDTRGHGHSEAPKGPYTIEQLTGDVLACRWAASRASRSRRVTRTASSVSY
jgi:3-oxoadipate enol-lactonase